MYSSILLELGERFYVKSMGLGTNGWSIIAQRSLLEDEQISCSLFLDILKNQAFFDLDGVDNRVWLLEFC